MNFGFAVVVFVNIVPIVLVETVLTVPIVLEDTFPIVVVAFLQIPLLQIFPLPQAVPSTAGL